MIECSNFLFSTSSSFLVSLILTISWFISQYSLLMFLILSFPLFLSVNFSPKAFFLSSTSIGAYRPAISLLLLTPPTPQALTDNFIPPLCPPANPVNSIKQLQIEVFQVQITQYHLSSIRMNPSIPLLPNHLQNIHPFLIFSSLIFSLIFISSLMAQNNYFQFRSGLGSLFTISISNRRISSMLILLLWYSQSFEAIAFKNLSGCLLSITRITQIILFIFMLISCSEGSNTQVVVWIPLSGSMKYSQQLVQRNSMKLGCCLMETGRSDVSDPMADKSYPLVDFWVDDSLLIISSWLAVLEDWAVC